METRHAAYSLAYKTGAIFGGHFGGKNPRLIAEEIRYLFSFQSRKYQDVYVLKLSRACFLLDVTDLVFISQCFAKTCKIIFLIISTHFLASY